MGLRDKLISMLYVGVHKQEVSDRPYQEPTPIVDKCTCGEGVRFNLSITRYSITQHEESSKQVFMITTLINLMKDAPVDKEL